MKHLRVLLALAIFGSALLSTQTHAQVIRGRLEGRGIERNLNDNLDRSLNRARRLDRNVVVGGRTANTLERDLETVVGAPDSDPVGRGSLGGLGFPIVDPGGGF